MTNPFLGEIRLFGGTFAPVGWNFCDGSIQQISGNDALFQLLGSTFGGDGIQTFALPDLRGRVPIHQGTGTGGIGTYTIGNSGGAESVVLDATNLPSHTHKLQATTNAGKATDPTNAVLAQALSDCKIFAPSPKDTVYAAAHVGSAGLSVPHDNLQPFLAINYIIAMAGIYPSQG